MAEVIHLWFGHHILIDMKSSNITILFCLALGAFSSCQSLNDMLDRYPLDTVSPGSYFIDESQLSTYTNNCYSLLLSTDIYDAQNDIYFKKNLTNLQRGGTMRPLPSSGGGWSFEMLRHINTLFSYIDNCKEESIKAEYTALARFFRACYYYKMVRDFGDVNWIDRELFSDDPLLYGARDSREVVMDHMIEDIDAAIDGLPSVVKSRYLVNRWTALAFKTRFLLFEGTWRKYHASDAYAVKNPKHDYKYYLDLAAQAAQEFIETSPYRIYSTGTPELDYRVLFCTQDANADEVILARNYSLISNHSHFASWIAISNQVSDGLSINKKFIDAYLCADGSRFTDKAGWQTMEYFDEVSGRDPRLSQTIRTPGYLRFKSEPSSLNPVFSPLARPTDLANNLSGYQTVKFDQGYDVCPDTWTATDADLPIMRAAEVLLNFAEAKAELGSISQNDLDISINVLRDRVGMPHLILSKANANPDDAYLGNAKYGFRNVKGSDRGIILEVRRERMVELAQEGDFRWYDLMRWKEGKCMEQPFLGMYLPGAGEYDFNRDGEIDLCLYKDEDPQTTATLVYKIDSDIYLSEGDHGYLNYIEAKKISHVFNEERDYLMPIPTSELAMNPNLTQNPGWIKK